MMDEERFWEILDLAWATKESEDMNELGDRLMEILIELEVQEIAGFHKRMLQLRESIRSPRMRDVASKMGYGDNGTAHQYFLNWVVALGKEHFIKAKESPNYLLKLNDPKLFVIGQAGFEDLDHVAQAAFFEKADSAVED